jgi:RNA polymerase sigma-70 factor (ECF subfamily)
MLYDRHVDAVYRLAYRMAGDDALAQDWVQETFVRAFGRLGQYRGEAAFGTWLRTVANSVALNGLRKVKQDWNRETDLETSIPIGHDQEHSDPTVRARIDRAIDELPDKYRLVFVMYDVEGYTHDEIASSLGITTTASKVQLSRARAKLRTQLADLMVDQ